MYCLVYYLCLQQWRKCLELARATGPQQKSTCIGSDDLSRHVSCCLRGGAMLPGLPLGINEGVKSHFLNFWHYKFSPPSFARLTISPTVLFSPPRDQLHVPLMVIPLPTGPSRFPFHFLFPSLSAVVPQYHHPSFRKIMFMTIMSSVATAIMWGLLF